MPSKLAFATKRFLQAASASLQKSMSDPNLGRLYLHIGGRLIGDHHAARVLPGYDPATKLKFVQALKSKASFVYCISQDDLKRKRIRGDNGLEYEDEVIRSIDELRDQGIIVDCIVVIGHKLGEESKKIVAYARENKIVIESWAKARNILSPGFSIEQFPLNHAIKFKKKLVVILSPGSNSGKFDFSLHQILLEAQANTKVAYLRLHIFPVFQFHPLHPLNLAFFAASADVYDYSPVLGIQPSTSISDAWKFYNRDQKVDELLDTIAQKTGMVDKKASRFISIVSGITNIEPAIEASLEEISRRRDRYAKEVANHQERQEVLDFTSTLSRLAPKFSQDSRIVLRKEIK